MRGALCGDNSPHSSRSNSGNGILPYLPLYADVLGIRILFSRQIVGIQPDATEALNLDYLAIDLYIIGVDRR